MRGQERRAFRSGEHVMYDLYFNWKFILEEGGHGQPHHERRLTNPNRHTASTALRESGQTILLQDARHADLLREQALGAALLPQGNSRRGEAATRWTGLVFPYEDGLSKVKQRRAWRNPARETQEMEYSEQRRIFDMLSILRRHAPTTRTTTKRARIHFPMSTGREWRSPDPDLSGRKKK